METKRDGQTGMTRRDFVSAALVSTVAAMLPRSNATIAWAGIAVTSPNRRKENEMSTITMKDGAEIYYKDWGKGQPIVFHHGWPLSLDDRDTQMLFFVQHGTAWLA